MLRKEITIKTDFFKVWECFISKGDSSIVPFHIKSSWQRCREANLDPEKKHITEILDNKSIEELTEKQRDIYQIVSSYYNEMEKYYESFSVAFIFLNNGGYVLSVEGNKEIAQLLEDKNIKKGACSKEIISGTSAPGICLEEKRFAAVTAEEHYLRIFHWASCLAIPIFDEKKNLIGILDITTHINYANQLQYLMPTAFDIAHSIQFEYFLKKKIEEKIKLLTSYFNTTFNYAKDPLILINKNGNIIDLNTTAQRILNTNHQNIKQNNIRIEINKRYVLNPNNNALLEIPVYINGIKYNTYITPITENDDIELTNLFLLRLDKQESIKSLTIDNKMGVKYTFNDIITQNSILKNIIEKTKNASKTSSTVLLEGETGVGKELFAQSIHNESYYKNGPFVALNCAAIPKELVESELFGYEKGAYTGALKDGNQGKFELANKGTLFLDEIQALDLNIQSKLLRALETKEIFKIGGKKPIQLDVRIITACSVSLEKEVKEGRFIAPLFFRLNVVKIRIPALKERKEDIPILIEYFLKEMCEKLNKNIKGISKDAVDFLKNYSWPGNVRELKNCLEAACNFCKNNEYVTLKDVIELINFTDLTSKIENETKSGIDKIDEILKKVFIEALKNKNYNKKAAALSLGIPLSTFYRKIKQFKI